MAPIDEGEDEVTDSELGLILTSGTYRASSSIRDVDLCLVWTTDAEDDVLHAFFRKGTHRPLVPSYRRFYQMKHRYRGVSITMIGCRSSDQGSLDMRAALEDVYRHFRPRMVCLVGIAGGLDDALNIGDVAVAKRVLWYERGKETDSGTSRELIPFTPDRVTMRLVDAVIGDMRRRRSDFVTVLTPFAAGEKVVASQLGQVRTYLQTVDRHLGAVEMESGGFFHYFVDADFRGLDDIWLVVKGISDHADPAKGDSDQTAAAENAVRAALDLYVGLTNERSKIET